MQCVIQREVCAAAHPHSATECIRRQSVSGVQMVVTCQRKVSDAGTVAQASAAIGDVPLACQTLEQGRRWNSICLRVRLLAARQQMTGAAKCNKALRQGWRLLHVGEGGGGVSRECQSHCRDWCQHLNLAVKCSKAWEKGVRAYVRAGERGAGGALVGDILPQENKSVLHEMLQQ